MYQKTTFQNKSRKRMLEDRLTDIKIAFNSGANIAPGYAISLTGPAVAEHINNYSRLGVKGVIIAENNYDTYLGIRQDVAKIIGGPNIAVHYKDVDEVVLNSFMTKITPIIDIDLDFTATPKNVMGTVSDVLRRMDTIIGKHSLADRFTFTVTFCQRNAGRDSVNNGYESIVNFFNLSSGFNIVRAYKQSYRDGSPMVTAMYLIDKLTTKVFKGPYDDIEPLLITTGKRKF